MLMRSLGEFPNTSFGMAERIFSALYPPYKPEQGMRQLAKDHWNELEAL